MNMKSYLKKLGSASARQKYADRAGTTMGLLYNISCGSKEPMTMKKIADLIAASDYEITLVELCPDFFSGPNGHKYMRIVKKMCAETPAKPRKKAAA